MPKANIKKGISILTTIALILIAGCSNPEEKRTQSLAEVAQLKAAGNDATALELLETLSQNFPDDSEILRQIGLLHQKMGNDSEAAFYLSAAQNLSPDDPELLYQTYLAHEKAEQTDSASDLLEAFATASPEAMTNTLWFRLGELRAKEQKTETALTAYLEGIKLTNDKPSAEIALAIGTLFKQLGNMPMARRWLAIAAKSDDSNSLQALFGVLEINLRDKNWEAAESTIALLDKKFPGAVDASEWADVRNKLKKWRAAQTEMKAKLEQLAKAKQTTQAKQSSAQVKSTEPVKPSNEPAISSAPSPETSSGKEQVVSDIANATALADTPASKAEPVETSTEPPTTPTETSEPAIVFDPSIDIQPAEPNLDTESDTTDQQDQGDLVDYSAESSNSEAQSKPQETQPEITRAQPTIIEAQPEIIEAQPEVTQSQPEPAPEPDVSPPDTTLLTLDELITRARAATSGRDYEKAIQIYWDALGRDNKRADIWNNLSKVYLSDGQSKNAATTALEATRLDPENVQYVLDYLRVAQRVKRPADFIKELEIAYERFPRSPEITLSLARGYQRIGLNNYAAGILYRRFIKMAPTHPLRPEAEAALARIR